MNTKKINPRRRRKQAAKRQSRKPEKRTSGCQPNSLKKGTKLGFKANAENSDED